MVVITPAAPVHVREAAQVLAGTFREDALMSSVVGGRPQDREERLTHLFGAMVRSGLRRGAVDLARTEGDPTVLGVAVWTAPRTRSGAGIAVREVAAYLRAFGLTGMRRASRIERALESAHPTEPHWFLAAIGVHADGRGKGVGSALLSSRLSTVDSTAPAPAYLEASTDRSAALYGRHGFVASGRIDVAPSAASPVAMWRPVVRDRVVTPAN